MKRYRNKFICCAPQEESISNDLSAHAIFMRFLSRSPKHLSCKLALISCVSGVIFAAICSKTVILLDKSRNK